MASSEQVNVRYFATTDLVWRRPNVDFASFVGRNRSGSKRPNPDQRPDPLLTPALRIVRRSTDEQQLGWEVVRRRTVAIAAQRDRSRSDRAHDRGYRGRTGLCALRCRRAGKRALSSETQAQFVFDAPGLTIEANVDRRDFENWIAEDLQRIALTVDAALDQAGVAPDQIDHVFLTGGSSQIPAVRRLFEQRFGENRIARGNELTSIAHGLGLMAAGADLADWVIEDEM